MCGTLYKILYNFICIGSVILRYFVPACWAARPRKLETKKEPCVLWHIAAKIVDTQSQKTSGLWHIIAWCILKVCQMFWGCMPYVLCHMYWCFFACAIISRSTRLGENGPRGSGTSRARQNSTDYLLEWAVICPKSDIPWWIPYHCDDSAIFTVVHQFIRVGLWPVYGLNI